MDAPICAAIPSIKPAILIRQTNKSMARKPIHKYIAIDKNALGT